MVAAVVVVVMAETDCWLLDWTRMEAVPQRRMKWWLRPHVHVHEQSAPRPRPRWRPQSHSQRRSRAFALRKTGAPWPLDCYCWPMLKALVQVAWYQLLYHYQRVAAVDRAVQLLLRDEQKKRLLLIVVVVASDDAEENNVDADDVDADDTAAVAEQRQEREDDGEWSKQ